jgi:hypothetical protein
LLKKRFEFMRERAREQRLDSWDLEGLRSFAGHGLESLNSPRQAESNARAPKARAPQLFSDLNQWNAESSARPANSEEYLSAPRGQYQGASQLAEAAGVSVMSAFRFMEELSKEGFLDSGRRAIATRTSSSVDEPWGCRKPAASSRHPDAVGCFIAEKEPSQTRSVRTTHTNGAPNFGDPQWMRRPRLCFWVVRSCGKNSEWDSCTG